MADPRDKPPVLRVFVLLVALVGTALALAALSPQQPDPVDAPAAGADTAASVNVQPAPPVRP